MLFHPLRGGKPRPLSDESFNAYFGRTAISIHTALTKSLGAQNFDYQVVTGSFVSDEQIDAVMEAAPDVEQYEIWNTASANLIYPDGNIGNLYGITALNYDTAFYAPEITQGRWLQAGDDHAVVVSFEFLKQEPEYALGGSVSLQIGGVTDDFTIVGVVEEIGTAGIYIDRTGFRQLVSQSGMRSSINMITAQMKGRQTEKYLAITDFISEQGILLSQKRLPFKHPFSAAVLTELRISLTLSGVDLTACQVIGAA